MIVWILLINYSSYFTYLDRESCEIKKELYLEKYSNVQCVKGYKL